MKTCLVYGDSNSHGTPPIADLGVDGRLPKAQRWPQVMAAGLGPDWDVITDGLPGRTTVHEDMVEGGARNGLAVLPAALHAHKPLDLLILMLGTNDLKHRFSVTGYEIASSLFRLVRCAQIEGVVRKIMVVSPVPVVETGTLAEAFTGAEVRQMGLAAELQKRAEDAGIAFFDAGQVAVVSPIDGVHLDAAAHQALGQAMVAEVTNIEF